MNTTRKKPVGSAKAPDQRRHTIHDVTLQSSIAMQALEQIEDPETAQEGWARLYGVLATYLKAGVSPPMPMAVKVAERLHEVSDKLLSKRTSDTRDAIWKAVLPVRVRGRRRSTANRLVIEGILLDALMLASRSTKRHVFEPSMRHAERLVYAAKNTSLKDIDLACKEQWRLCQGMDPKLPTFNENTLIAETRKLRNTLRESDKEEKNNLRVNQPMKG